MGEISPRLYLAMATAAQHTVYHTLAYHPMSRYKQAVHDHAHNSHDRKATKGIRRHFLHNQLPSH